MTQRKSVAVAVGILGLLAVMGALSFVPVWMRVLVAGYLAGNSAVIFLGIVSKICVRLWNITDEEVARGER